MIWIDRDETVLYPFHRMLPRREGTVVHSFLQDKFEPISSTPSPVFFRLSPNFESPIRCNLEPVLHCAGDIPCLGTLYASLQFEDFVSQGVCVLNIQVRIIDFISGILFGLMVSVLFIWSPGSIQKIVFVQFALCGKTRLHRAERAICKNCL